MKNWAVKVTIITFFIAFAVSMASEIATSVSGIVVATIILLFLILVSILTDGLGVAVTACDIEPLKKIAEKNVIGAKCALILVERAEKVNNICSDVIGDICSIISGACGAAIAVEIIEYIPNIKLGLLLAITVNSFIAGLTVGGKAAVKSIAVNKSLEFVVYSSKIICKFYNFEKLITRDKRKK